MFKKINLIINLHISKQTHRNEGALIVFSEGMHLVKKCDRSNLDAKVLPFYLSFQKLSAMKQNFGRKKNILFVIKSFQGFALIFSFFTIKLFMV